MKRVMNRKPVGDCLIECAVGGVFLVMVGLFLLNGVSVLFCNSIHDKVAFNAARAAANAKTDAAGAARQMIALQPTRKPLIESIKLVDCKVLSKDKRVEVTTEMTVGLPAQLPILPKNIRFQARSIQTITAEAPIALPI